MSSLTRRYDWFVCPTCGGALTGVDGHDDPVPATTRPASLRCETGHRVDVSRRSTLSLLRGPARFTGDTESMVKARSLALESGAYAPIAAAITDIARGAGEPPQRTLRIVDAASGPAYYAHRIAGRLETDGRASSVLALDASPAAVRAAVSGDLRTVGAVFDLFAPWPLRDACADLVLNVFGPRNVDEFARVLDPFGVLCTVIPAEHHFEELREAGLTLGLHPGKLADVMAQLERRFTLKPPERLTFTVSELRSPVSHLAAPSAPPRDAGRHSLESRSVADEPPTRPEPHVPTHELTLGEALIGMGPSAFHASASADGASGPVMPHSVTIDVWLLVGHPR